MICIFFHRWSRWEQYIESGYTVFSGILVNKESRGKTMPYQEQRQKRTCNDCGKIEDVLIKSD